MRKSIIAVLVTAVINGPAWAQAPGSSTGAGIDAREANQQRRIEQGIKSGTLTPGETKRLEGREVSIQRHEERMRARDGGQLTKQDRAALNRHLDNTSRVIYNKKHD